ncbi:MAG: hypothetical protein IIW87_00820, partial [Alistipes sp.]|nr:hypothetical protein [Alistipes sp.]
VEMGSYGELWVEMGSYGYFPINPHQFPSIPTDTINVIPSLSRDLLVGRTVDNEHIARRFFDFVSLRSE